MKELAINPTFLGGVDCFHMTAANVLKYSNYDYATSLWKQCGLVYSKSGPNGTGVIRPYILNRSQEAKWINGVHLVKLKNLTKQDFVKEITTILNYKKPVIINVDSYYLKYNQFYMKKHLNHYVTAIHIKGDQIKIVDDSYNYKGYLTIDEVYASTISETSIFKINSEIMYFDLSKTKQLSSEDYLNVIKFNHSLLNGSIEEQKFVEVCSNTDDLKPVLVDWSSTIFGINAIHELIREYKHFTQDKENLNEEFYFNMYAMFTFISNSRFLFKTFLEEGSQIIPSVDKTIYILKKSTQQWKVASNMMLKGMYKDGDDMVKRMFHKLEEIIECENLLIENLESLILDKQN